MFMLYLHVYVPPIRFVWHSQMNIAAHTLNKTIEIFISNMEQFIYVHVYGLNHNKQHSHVIRSCIEVE